MGKRKNKDSFEDGIRIIMHDILKHVHEHWEAFKEAAMETQITADQALASLLAKAVCEYFDEHGR